MSKYPLLRSLYLGRSSNADLTSKQHRGFIHVTTGLDRTVPELLAAGRDVVLTGNPGDGKSHLARRLEDRSQLSGAATELDLSAETTSNVVKEWEACRRRGQPYLLCANEGPLLQLVADLRHSQVLQDTAKELQHQVGHLTAARTADLAQEPREAVLIDLADRDLTDETVVAAAIGQVCQFEYMPPLPHAMDTLAGCNIDWLAAEPDARNRLARLIAAAGRRAPRHITFRELWAAISFGICRGLSETSLSQLATRGEVGVGSGPLDNLCAQHGQGQLLRAFRRHADPARVPLPQLDEQLWHDGRPERGSWLVDEEDLTSGPPAALWSQGKHADAQKLMASLKRHVALFHSEGEILVERVLAHDHLLVSGYSDDDLQEMVCSGIRRQFLTGRREPSAPSWLREGLPLWLGFTYQDEPVGQRPQVATIAVAPTELRVLRPVRVQWLSEALGPLPELAWLEHPDSGVALRLTPDLLGQLREAELTEGLLDPPSAVTRFLSRLSGWAEARRPMDEEHFAVLERPRGRLLADGQIQRPSGGARYV